jgi:hypothetical protein
MRVCVCVCVRARVRACLCVRDTHTHTSPQMAVCRDALGLWSTSTSIKTWRACVQRLAPSWVVRHE